MGVKVGGWSGDGMPLVQGVEVQCEWNTSSHHCQSV